MLREELGPLRDGRPDAGLEDAVRAAGVEPAGEVVRRPVVHEIRVGDVEEAPRVGGVGRRLARGERVEAAEASGGGERLRGRGERFPEQVDERVGEDVAGGVPAALAHLGAPLGRKGVRERGVRRLREVRHEVVDVLVEQFGDVDRLEHVLENGEERTASAWVASSPFMASPIGSVPMAVMTPAFWSMKRLSSWTHRAWMPAMS